MPKDIFSRPQKVVEGVWRQSSRRWRDTGGGTRRRRVTALDQLEVRCAEAMQGRYGIRWPSGCQGLASPKWTHLGDASCGCAASNEAGS